MMAVDVRFEEDAVKVRRFGTGESKGWAFVRSCEVDRLTGWSYEELRSLGEGIWGFPETPAMNRSPLPAGA